MASEVNNCPGKVLPGYNFVWSIPLTTHIPEIKIQSILEQ